MSQFGPVVAGEMLDFSLYLLYSEQVQMDVRLGARG